MPLKDVHTELGQSQFGRHVNAKLRVTEYVRDKHRWETKQKTTLEGPHAVQGNHRYYVMQNFQLQSALIQNPPLV